MRILAPRYYLISIVLLYVLHLLMDYYLINTVADNLYKVFCVELPIVIRPSSSIEPNIQYGSVGILPT